MSGPNRRPTPRASFSIRPGWLEGSDHSTSVATTDLPAPDITTLSSRINCAATNKLDKCSLLCWAGCPQSAGCLLDDADLCRTQAFTEQVIGTCESHRLGSFACTVFNYMQSDAGHPTVGMLKQCCMPAAMLPRNIQPGGQPSDEQP